MEEGHTQLGLARGTFAEKDPTIAGVSFGAHKFGSLTQTTTELEDDSGVNVGELIAEHAGWSIAQVVGPALATGAGTTEPNGLFVSAGVGKTSAAVAAVTLPELMEMKHSVDPAYRSKAQWVMNDATWLACSQLVDGNGNLAIGSYSEGSGMKLLANA